MGDEFPDVPRWVPEVNLSRFPVDRLEKVFSRDVGRTPFSERCAELEPGFCVIERVGRNVEGKVVVEIALGLYKLERRFSYLNAESRAGARRFGQLEHKSVKVVLCLDC